MLLKVTRKLQSASMCACCGVDNPFTLGTRFYVLENGLLVGLVSGRDVHQSYPGRMHGGMISMLLDEAIGRAVNIPEPDAFGVTSELKVKFLKPVPLNEELRVVGKLTKNTRLVFTAEAFIEDISGTILARGWGTYVKLPPERISGRSYTPVEWSVRPDDLTEVEVVNHDFWDREKA